MRACAPATRSIVNSYILNAYACMHGCMIDRPSLSLNRNCLRCISKYTRTVYPCLGLQIAMLSPISMQEKKAAEAFITATTCARLAYVGAA